MATIADYPTPSVNAANPTINKLVRHPIDYPVTRYEFEDGGQDVNVSPCGLRRWDLTYEGLTPAQLQIIADHFNAAKGKTNDFSFYDHHAAETITGVIYGGFEVQQHRHKQSLFADVTLIAYL